MGMLERVLPLRSGPTSYNFTERVRRALALARDAAARLDHDFVGTEHILLGLLDEGGGVASTVLARFGIGADDLRTKIERRAGPGKAGGATSPELPYTSRAKRVLELAMSEAHELHHGYVGTEHLLLGVVAEAQGIAAVVLREEGVTIERARAETVYVLSGADPEAPLHDDPPGRARRATPSMPTSADQALETLAWQRVRHAVDLSLALGTSPSLALGDDGALTVSLGDALTVRVEFPPHVRIERRAEPPA